MTENAVPLDEVKAAQEARWAEQDAKWARESALTEAVKHFAGGSSKGQVAPVAAVLAAAKDFLEFLEGKQ